MADPNKTPQAIKLWKQLRRLANQAQLIGFTLPSPYAAYQERATRAGNWHQALEIIQPEALYLTLEQLGFSETELQHPIVQITSTLTDRTPSLDRTLSVSFAQAQQGSVVEVKSEGGIRRRTPYRHELKFLRMTAESTSLAEAILQFGKDDFWPHVRLGLGEEPDREGIWSPMPYDNWMLFQLGFDTFLDGLQELISGYNSSEDAVKSRKQYLAAQRLCQSLFPPRQ
ncbi:MAG TPA: hypothetical protein VNG90_03335 [Candidatus Acidoferrum sp.]|nr:hypothetical protein [Candidatus Acidoferrum sp.]